SLVRSSGRGWLMVIISRTSPTSFFRAMDGEYYTGVRWQESLEDLPFFFASGLLSGMVRECPERGRWDASPSRLPASPILSPSEQGNSRVMSSMNPLLLTTRRHFFQDCAVGLGSIAL